MSGDIRKAMAEVLGSLRADHDEMRALFRLYEEEPSEPVGEHLLWRICRAVRLHCSLEAGVFVPVVAAAANNPALLEQTGAAYACVIGMVNALSAPRKTPDRPYALVTELSNYVNQHIEAAEAQDGPLALAPRLTIDWKTTNMRLATRRAELAAFDDRNAPTIAPAVPFISD